MSDNMPAARTARSSERKARPSPFSAKLQTAFNQFLQNRTYFPSAEPHCPWDAAKATHYTYQYNPAVNPSAEGIKILCPVPKSDHGSVP